MYYYNSPLLNNLKIQINLQANIINRERVLGIEVTQCLGLSKQIPPTLESVQIAQIIVFTSYYY